MELNRHHAQYNNVFNFSTRGNGIKKDFLATEISITLTCLLRILYYIWVILFHIYLGDNLGNMLIRLFVLYAILCCTCLGFMLILFILWLVNIIEVRVVEWRLLEALCKNKCYEKSFTLISQFTSKTAK